MTGRKWLALLCGAAAAVVATSLVVRINVSPSIPEGIYLVVPGEIRRGAIIEVCQPEWVKKLASTRDAEGLCPDGSMTSLKPVAAVAGDVVVISAEGVEVNGTPLPNSRPIPAIPRTADGIYTVAPGELWLISSHHPASIDSRYYGARPASAVLRVVKPLYTW